MTTPRTSIAYPFAAVPTAMLDEIDHPTAERLFRVVYECIWRGWMNPPIRYLVARVGRCYRQVVRGLAILEASGYLRIIRRRRSRTRNYPNRYEIPGLEPCDANVTEVLKARSKSTKAPPPAAADLKTLVRKLRARLAEQAKFFKDYINRGQQIRHGRLWREKKELEAVKMRMLATVGRGPEWEEGEGEAARKHYEDWLRTKGGIS